MSKLIKDKSYAIFKHQTCPWIPDFANSMFLTVTDTHMNDRRKENEGIVIFREIEFILH